MSAEACDVIALAMEQSQYVISDDSGMNILSFDNNTIEPDTIFHKHIHYMLEISIIKEGHGVYEIGENTYELHSGDVFIISNSEPHRIFLHAGQRVVNTVIHFEPFFLHDFLSRYSSSPLLDIFFRRIPGFSNRLDASLPAAQRIYKRVLDIEEEMNAQKPHYPLYVKVLLESIFCELLRSFQGTANTQSKLASRKDLYNIDKTLHYINFNLGEHMTLNDLAAIAHVSPAYFSSIFKRCMGVSLFEYIAQRRVGTACQLILTSSKTLTEISQACGFNNYTSFINTFRKFIGCSPSDYRRSPQACEGVVR